MWRQPQVVHLSLFLLQELLSIFTLLISGTHPPTPPTTTTTPMESHTIIVFKCLSHCRIFIFG